MPDCQENYEEMYFTLFRASEEALDILITARRKCEEMYLAAGEKGEDTK